MQIPMGPAGRPVLSWVARTLDTTEKAAAHDVTMSHTQTPLASGGFFCTSLLPLVWVPIFLSWPQVPGFEVLPASLSPLSHSSAVCLLGTTATQFLRILQNSSGGFADWAPLGPGLEV
jgi:hypothetical protein